MSSPFTAGAIPSMPVWTGISEPDGNFQPVSGTGQTIVSGGGYGLGGYGGGLYGTGEETTLTLTTEFNTTWTAYTTK